MRLGRLSSLFPLLGLLTAPSAAKVVLYTLNLTVGESAPDGFSRSVYLVNGQTPGPEIVATQGDLVSVRVENNLDVDTTVHFHGISQQGSIWSDGVPGVTQRMIPPGGTFVSNWTASEHGVYWYHAHSQTIYADGVRGIINILPSNDDLESGPWSGISENPVHIAAMKKAHLESKRLTTIDWSHWTSAEGLEERNRTQLETICWDSLLVNGKGRVICPSAETTTPLLTKATSKVTAKGCAWRAEPAGISDVLNPDICSNTTAPFDVVSVSAVDLYASFAIVNMGTTWSFRVSIDDHPMWVYAADGQFHAPQKVDVLEIASGERYQVMVRLDKPLRGDHTIRVASASSAQFISGYAILSYNSELADASTLPPSNNPAIDYGGNVLPGYTSLDPLSLQVYPSSLTPPFKANVTLIMDMFRLSNITWALNKNPMSPFIELDEPLLFRSNQSLDSNLVPAYPVGSVVDVVIISNAGNPRHPIHKHGMKSWIIGNGQGNWTWLDVDAAQKDHPEYFNLATPSRRDGFFTADASAGTRWLVIRYEVTEPGVIFFHCHIANHLYGGMAVALMEGMTTEPPTIPDYYVAFNNFAGASKSKSKHSRIEPRSRS